MLIMSSCHWLLLFFFLYLICTAILLGELRFIYSRFVQCFFCFYSRTLIEVLGLKHEPVVANSVIEK